MQSRRRPTAIGRAISASVGIGDFQLQRLFLHNLHTDDRRCCTVPAPGHEAKDITALQHRYWRASRANFPMSVAQIGGRFLFISENHVCLTCDVREIVYGAS